MKQKGGWPKDYANLLETKRNSSANSRVTQLDLSKPVNKRKKTSEEIRDYYNLTQENSATNLKINLHESESSKL